MQKVLSLLLAYVLLQAQSFALRGGPVFPTGLGLNVVGTYAGVLIPTQTKTASVSSPTDSVSSSAAIGLFTLGVNDSGPAIGAAIVFVKGTSFNGNIIGVADPGSGAISAIVDAVSTFTIQRVVRTGTDENGNPTFTVVESNVFAQGSVEAAIAIIGATPSPFAIAPGSTRVVGTASLDIFGTIKSDGTPNVTETAKFTVDGFKQSDTVSDVTGSLLFGTNFNNG